MAQTRKTTAQATNASPRRGKVKKMDLTALAPEPTEMTARKATRSAGPNPFLDNGWIRQSYDTSTAYQVTVAGEWQDKPVKAKNDAGEMVETGEIRPTLTGDAANVVYLVRQAAEKEGLGVRVETVQATRKNGNPIAGQVTVKYQGIARKQRGVRKNG
jgi:hypothetical protein